MSSNLENSEVSEINRNAGIKPIAISKDTFTVIERSLYYSKLTDGLFDITLGPLVKLWGIGSDSPYLPTREEVFTYLPLVDYNNISLDRENQTVMLNNSEMGIDLGAISKGYIADKVKELLLQNNVQNAIIDLGGNILFMGEKEGSTPWNIGIKNPFSDDPNEFVGTIPISDTSIVTSGVYERFFKVDNVLYHHILDPNTGFPIENDVMSVTIFTDKSIDADSLSTSLFSLGVKKGLETIENIDGAEALFINKDSEIFLSTGLKDKFKLTDDSFSISK